MLKTRLRHFLHAALVSIAIYPIVMIAVWLFVALGVMATDQHLATDMMPLIYGLIFAALTLALIDLLGVAAVVMALIAGANLIEYAQLVVPGRAASPVDFTAGMAGVVLAALLVCTARALLQRIQPETENAA